MHQLLNVMPLRVIHWCLRLQLFLESVFFWMADLTEIHFFKECVAVQNGLSGLDWDLLEAIGLERFCPPLRPRRGLLRGWPRPRWKRVISPHPLERLG